MWVVPVAGLDDSPTNWRSSLASPLSSVLLASSFNSSSKALFLTYHAARIGKLGHRLQNMSWTVPIWWLSSLYHLPNGSAGGHSLYHFSMQGLPSNNLLPVIRQPYHKAYYGSLQFPLTYPKFSGYCFSEFQCFCLICLLSFLKLKVL